MFVAGEPRSINVYCSKDRPKTFVFSTGALPTTYVETGVRALVKGMNCSLNERFPPRVSLRESCFVLTAPGVDELCSLKRLDRPLEIGFFR